MRVDTNSTFILHKNISEDIQEMPQSQSTSLPRHEKKDRWGTNNDKTNSIYEAKDAQPKNCNRGFALERSVGKLLSITKTCIFKYTENFTIKKWIFSDKTFWYFSCFCSKHILRILVRTASTRRFWRVSTIYVFEQKWENNVYPCKPQFYYIKVGFKGVKIIKVRYCDGSTYAKPHSWFWCSSQITNVCLVLIGAHYLICETSQWNTYNEKLW